ncbi:Trypanosomal VSG domain containing protein [Trypanosoma brucei equiperdum]|uniref:Trypanosomal VSG domain containing protein n=1 Tax=Trypanosoma brucei equiperdum TaxID=630700 RepID=A0A3L6L7M6_9TRYP|nr:Trypanosomal VSG domain containing protein [Trypanosoma brucei equiperdum]RHW72052.1 Trypanosomal VSG domain containing protein [Trypanosoma brucei equiperdum]RHW72162.1 Trypanosomal VSG domain containing protein [Trypanosoma brucei equiperdum]RHW72235.1 Trypanosomal VSG domain containing protein [Trypanosoma brucei equiperdum]
MFRFIALTVVFSAAICKQSSGAAGEGANAAAFTTLCTIDQLAAADLAAAYTKPDDITPPLKQIRQIVAATTNRENITAVPHTINIEADTAAKEACNTKGSKKEDCEQHWKKWHQVKKDAQAVKSTTKFKDLTADERKKPLTAITAEELALIEEEATKLHSQLKDFDNLADHQKLKAARKELNKARFGKDVTVFTGVTGASAPMGASRAAGCAHPNAGTSIAHDMMCLCSTDNSNSGIAKPCGFDAACGGSTWEACTKPEQERAYGKIQTACRRIQAHALTAATLAALRSFFLNALAGNVGGDMDSTGAVILGQHNTNNCGGAQAKRASTTLNI